MPSMDTASPRAARIAYAACPLCDSSRIALLRADDCTRHPLYRPVVPPRITWMSCTDCAHVFTDGYFTPEVAGEVFASTLPHQRPGADAEAQRYVSARMVEKLARHADGGAWLDVGFGNASLLMTAAEFGFEPVGLDLRSQSVAALRQMGSEAH